MVITKRLLIQIPEQMKGFHGNVCSIQSTLEQRPKIFDSVCVDSPVNVPLCMVNKLMHVFIFQALVSLQLIAIQKASKSNVLVNIFSERVSKTVCDDLSANVSTTFNHSHDLHFIFRAVALFAVNPARLNILVHVARFSTNESFVNFDFARIAAKFHHGTLLQGKTDSVIHEPSGFLRDLQSAGYFPRANAVAAINNHPHCSEPLVQAKR